MKEGEWWLVVFYVLKNPITSCSVVLPWFFSSAFSEANGLSVSSCFLKVAPEPSESGLNSLEAGIC